MGDLAVVPVERHGLEPEPPGLDQQQLDLLDRRLFGHVHGLGDATGQEGLDCAHHLHVPEIVDRIVAERAGEHRKVFRRQPGSAQDGVMPVDVRDDALDCGGGIPKCSKRPGNRPIDDTHGATADESLELHEAEIGFDAGRVAVHQQTDGSGRRKHRRLRIAHTVTVSPLACLVPGLTGRIENHRRGELLVDRGGGTAVSVEHPQHRLAIGVKAGERAHTSGKLGGLAICLPGHQGRETAGDRSSFVGVVGMAERHQECPEIGITEPELAESGGRGCDLFSRVVGVADENLLRRDDHAHRMGEPVHIEGVDPRCFGTGEKREQIQRSEIAGRIVEMEVLATRVARRDRTRVGRRVPVVDRCLELHPRISAFPRRLGDLSEEVASLHRAYRSPRGASDELPILVVDDGLHEIVGDANRIVRVLVLDRMDVGAIEAHVEPGRLEGACLAFFVGLAPDELFDVGMVDIEDHHLGCPPGLASRLDRAGGRIGATHEADWTRCGAATLEGFHRPPEVGQVDSSSRAPLEDPSLLGVPVQDRFHVVVDTEDEAGGGLLGHATDTDVEPDRRVERDLLVHQQMSELSAEGTGLGGVGEVAVACAPGAHGLDDAIDHLAQ